MSYLEELLTDFRKGTKIRKRDWEKGHYLYYDCKDIWNEDNELVSFSGEDLFCNSWELYQEPIDWDYIIKNKCMCLFWNDDETAIDILKCKYSDGFLTNYGEIWNNCRPVRRDEVTFYEDKKDE